MADITDEITIGNLRDWLAAQRAALNGRFRVALRRFPKLETEVVLALCRELLPPLASEAHPNLPALFEATFDLILLHAGRGTLTAESSGGRNPAIGVLLRETFPTLRSLLLTRPRSLPGALSNATENVGRQGQTFARTLPAVLANLTDADQVPAAGGLLAWRLGDARLRSPVLAAAADLPPSVVLAALGVPIWPTAAAPLLLNALATDGWRTPEQCIGTTILDELANGVSAERLESLRQRVVTRSVPRSAQWALTNRVGNFRGFGGDFEDPPVLLADGQATRHRFRVRSGGDVYRVDADVFGWMCSLDEPSATSPCFTQVPRGLEVPKGATSVLVLPDLAAYTRAVSFRISLLVPRGEPL